MDEPTFDAILNDLLNLMIKGHDLITKSAAVTFVSDLILENKQDLIAPKNSRKIAQKLVELFSQNSVSTCLQLKQSLVILYASCVGLQFKILRNFPETTQNLIKLVTDLPQELEFIKTVNLYEIMKNLPNEMIRSGGPEGKMLVRDGVPMLYINRYKNGDAQLKSVSTRVMKYLKDAIIEAHEKEASEDKHNLANIELENSEAILGRIFELLDSNSFDDRISAGLALEDLSQKMQSFDLARSATMTQILGRLFDLIKGKYFNKKELLLDSFAKVMELMEEESPWTKDPEFRAGFLDVCQKQIEKFSKSNASYKNKLIHLLNSMVAANKMNLPGLVSELMPLAELVLGELERNLEFISQSNTLSDSDKFSSFDEKRDEDQQHLLTVSLGCTFVSKIWFLPLPVETKAKYNDLIKRFYSATNFLVRNYILKNLNSTVAESIKYVKDPSTDFIDLDLLQTSDFIFGQTVKCGEKYDMNLE